MIIRTSESSPIEVAFVAEPSVPGRIGMTLAPGKHQEWGLRGAWIRDLKVDLARLREEFGTHILLCLLEEHEFATVKIERLPSAARSLGIDFWHFPIPDMGVPVDRRAARDLVERVCSAARKGDTVVIHCMGGLGRTGTIAASCLVALGEKPQEAIARVREVRPGAIENSRQERFVETIARELAANSDRE